MDFAKAKPQKGEIYQRRATPTKKTTSNINDFLIQSQTLIA